MLCSPVTTYLDHLRTLEIQASAQEWPDCHLLHPSPRKVENIPFLAAAQVQQTLQIPACASLLVHENIPKIPICHVWC